MNTFKYNPDLHKGHVFEPIIGEFPAAFRARKQFGKSSPQQMAETQKQVASKHKSCFGELSPKWARKDWAASERSRKLFWSKWRETFKPKFNPSGFTEEFV